MTPIVRVAPIASAGQFHVVVGDGQATADGADCTLQRFDMNGNHDTTFGDGGLAVFDIDEQGDYIEYMALLPDGKILVLGGTGEVVDPFTYIGDHGFLVRVNGDGSMDNSFGAGGKVMWGEVGSGTGAEGMAVSSAGDIFVSGLTAGETEAVSYTHLTLPTSDLV